MNTTSVEKANRVIEGLPLKQAKLLRFDLIPLGPLAPLHVLLDDNQVGNTTPSRPSRVKRTVGLFGVKLTRNALPVDVASGSCPEVRLNEAALRRTLSRGGVSSSGGSELWWVIRR